MVFQAFPRHIWGYQLRDILCIKRNTSYPEGAEIMDKLRKNYTGGVCDSFLFLYGGM